MFLFLLFVIVKEILLFYECKLLEYFKNTQITSCLISELKRNNYTVDEFIYVSYKFESSSDINYSRNLTKSKKRKEN